MLHNLAGRDFRNRRKQRQEKWGWWEDPYQTVTTDAWHQGKLSSHGLDIPAPNPKFGTEPPVHTAFGAV